MDDLDITRTLVANLLDLDGISDDVKDEIISGIGEVIFERFLTVMLTAEVDEQFAKLIDDGNIIAALNFALYNVPDAREALQLISQAVVEEFKSA